MGIEWQLSNAYQLEQFSSYVKGQWNQQKKPVFAEKAPKRSIDQNSISHTWYKQIATGKGDITVLEAKCQSKLHCGVPILRAEDDEFREQYDVLIKGRFEYEEKLALMKFWPVTSRMTKAQLNQYLEAMKAYWINQGVMLTFPEEWKPCANEKR